MKKLFTLLVVLAAAFILTACDGGKVQGVTDEEIIVGNTASTTGGSAFVGVPFNDAMRAVFKEVNDNGGIGGRKITLKTYNDESDAAKGKALTEKLVEEDKIFALVGHFGTPTVGATVEYIQDIGIPMVYAATGINQLYFKESLGNPVMAVQPIYLTDGRLMTARLLKEKLHGPTEDQAFGATDKVGVIYTNDDAGISIKAGVEEEAKALNRESSFIYEAVDSSASNAATAVDKLKNAGVKAAIIAMNQVPFDATYSAMDNANLNVPIFSSYVNADVTAVNHLEYKESRPVYTNAWVDVFSAKGQEGANAFVATITQADLSAELKAAYYTNAYATAGYIAARVFVEGLERVEKNGKELTWANYIAAMEEGPVDIPMGGTVDFSGGKRWGIDSMSLLKYTLTYGDNPATEEVETDFPIETFVKVREIETLIEIEAKE